MMQLGSRHRGLVLMPQMSCHLSSKPLHGLRLGARHVAPELARSGTSAAAWHQCVACMLMAHLSLLPLQLEARNPTPEPNEARELLSGAWRLAYTSNSELIALLALGRLPLVTVGEVCAGWQGASLCCCPLLNVFRCSAYGTGRRLRTLPTLNATESCYCGGPHELLCTCSCCRRSPRPLIRWARRWRTAWSCRRRSGGRDLGWIYRQLQGQSSDTESLRLRFRSSGVSKPWLQPTRITAALLTTAVLTATPAGLPPSQQDGAERHRVL